MQVQRNSPSVSVSVSLSLLSLSVFVSLYLSVSFFLVLSLSVCSLYRLSLLAYWMNKLKKNTNNEFLEDKWENILKCFFWKWFTHCEILEKILKTLRKQKFLTIPHLKLILSPCIFCAHWLSQESSSTSPIFHTVQSVIIESGLPQTDGCPQQQKAYLPCHDVPVAVWDN